MVAFLIYIDSVWPLLLCWYDFFFINLYILYNGYLLYTEYNIFYLLGYFLIQIFLLGVFLMLYQLDVLVAFFWLSELTIIFIFIFFLISLNYNVILNTINKFIKNFYLIIFSQFFIFYFLIIICTHFNFFYFYTSIIELWEHYYETLNSNILNDLFVFYLIYYFFNGYEFLLLMFLLLLSTVLCVRFNDFLYQYKFFENQKKNVNFKFFENYFNFFFLKKQNLIKQMFSLVFTQMIFKK